MANKIDAKLILELLQTPMSQREIIKTRHISSKSITAVCRRAAELGVSYEDLADKSDDEVYILFFPDKFQKETVYAPVNYEYVHGELKKTRVTLKLLWQEYKDGVKVGVPVGYTKFRDDYAKYVEQNNLTNHITHKPGDNCNFFHSHILINPVNMHNGKMMETDPESLKPFCEHVEKVTGCRNRLKFKKNDE